MTPALARAVDTRKVVAGEPGEVSIAELAALTGVAEATLRAWETRYGVPRPRRLPSGHRRYPRAEVELIDAAVEYRRAGMSVAAALERALATLPSPPESIFAALLEQRPELAPHEMDKRTLARISRAIEDECLARASPGLLVGAFQREAFYRPAEPRWRELAGSMEVTFVLADFGRRRVSTLGPSEVPFAERSPLRREWGLIGPAGCLLARERAGSARDDRRRVFDAIWSPEPEIVHGAGRIAISMLGEDPLAERAAAVLGPAPAPSSRELRRATSLTNRIIGYVAAG